MKILAKEVNESRLPNNYDFIMQNMNVERMARMNVRLVTINNDQLSWLTSVGLLFDYNDYNGALQFELNWLHQPIAPPVTNNPEVEETEKSDNN